MIYNVLGIRFINLKITVMKYNYETHRAAIRITDLPTHAYHPNASLRMNQRPAYVAWPTKEGKTN